MSQRIYLDDCAFDKDLVFVLTSRGHTVVTPADAGITHERDEIHFQYAATNSLVLLTKNPKDFRILHESNQMHSGILVIYQDNDLNRDMTHVDIARAIENLESSGSPIAGHFHALNAWRY